MKRKRRKKHGSRFRHAKKIVIITIIIFTVMLAACLYYISQRFSHPNVHIDRHIYPICGIDVSNHNGDIDFKQVAADTIAFVIIKASEGVNYTDPRFAKNYANARKEKLKVGAYHFFRKKKDGTAQADNFIRSVKGRKLDIPYVIDIEDWGDDLFIPEEEAIANLANMIKRLDQHGVKSMIYTNKDGYKKYVKRDFSHKRLWLCTFTPPNDISHMEWSIQQYSHWGTVAGITGEVDLNVFNGTREQWEAWLLE